MRIFASGIPSPVVSYSAAQGVCVIKITSQEAPGVWAELTLTTRELWALWSESWPPPARSVDVLPFPGGADPLPELDFPSLDDPQ